MRLDCAVRRRCGSEIGERALLMLAPLQESLRVGWRV
jgi:hypothetical protein